MTLARLVQTLDDRSSSSRSGSDRSGSRRSGSDRPGGDRHSPDRHWLRGLASLLLVIVALPSIAAAHAHLDASSPAANAAVTEPVDVVTLTFSEGIEVAFSTFKLYAIAGEVDLAAENADMRLNALAAQLVTSFNGTTDDGEGKIEAVVSADPDDMTSVTITASEALAPGHYVVMWRVLSADTHVIDGHFVFTVVAD
ncbi:MAG TPA: copper resistance protein CopC [Trueperaceae bacterium]|nr:copper resistance protein CopC [Trueperaceae bacterium]